MLTQLPKATAEARHIFVRINQALMESSQMTCGLILAQCTLSIGQLEALKAAAAQAEPDPDKRYMLESVNGMLLILLYDQQLTATHYVSLSVKHFLQEKYLFQGSLLIASFSEYGMPKETDVQAMLRTLKDETGFENTILIYNQQEAARKKCTILIIEEDEAVGELLGSQLQMKGYEVYIANSGLEGLQLFDALLPDLVITELSLPVYDGYEVIRSIRKKMHVDCSIIVLSDNQIEKDISACFEMGVSDYIKKPYSPVELEARVRRLLE